MINLLPGFEPSEADMIQMALDLPLERKIEKAILFYQTYCDGAYGAFSGGKDSCVIKQLAIDAGVNVDWHYNNVTIDPPELVQFIRKHHAEVKWNNPKIGLLKRMATMRDGPPMRDRRWCCRAYKECGGAKENKIIGVRISESAARSKRWSMVTPRREDKLIKFFAPIVYWTDEDVWNYIKIRQLPYCGLYDEGFTRLGCVGCPLASNSDRAKHFERWPKYHHAWKMAFKKMWENWATTPTKNGKDRWTAWDSWEAHFDWWVKGLDDRDNSGQCVFEEMMEQR